MKYIVKGKKKGKDKPFLDIKGNLVWDGVNKEIILSTCNFTELQANSFADNIKRNDKENRWKIWSEKTKDT
jgi:hypothetical protein